jgi:hypothetical protein
VPDFNTMYELFDPCTVMFFFRNKARTQTANMRHTPLHHAVALTRRTRPPRSTS